MSFPSSQLSPSEPLEFRRGDTNLTIPVDSGHRLAASVLLPPRSPWQSVYATLEPSGDVQHNANRLRATAWHDVGRYHLTWQGLPPGTYTLSVRLTTRGDALVRIPDVVVPLPPGGDPRLADIDLRSRVRTVALTLRDATGTELRGLWGLLMVAESGGDGELSAMPLHSSRSTVAVPNERTSLLIAVSGYRPCTVSCDGDDLDVRLESWPTLPVTISGQPELPPDVRLAVHFETVQAKTTMYRSPGADQAPLEKLTGAPTRSVTCKDGKATVPIADGPHTPILELTQGRQRVRVRDVQPTQVLPNVTSVTLTAPPDAWNEALAELLKEARKAAAK
jgi:hypothetical protein